MDMTDRDNILLESFFKEAAMQQIEDNGFTERVMAQVRMCEETSLKNRRLSMLWTWFCIAVAAVLFFLFSGWQLLSVSIVSILHTLFTWFSVLITTAPTADLHIDPVVLLLLAFFVLVFLPYQTYRKLSATL